MENKETAKYIERVNIKELWGLYDVNWTLNTDVNILVGENGTGKSTLLQCIAYLFEDKSTEIREKCTFMYIVFKDKLSIGLNLSNIPLFKPIENSASVFFIKTFDTPTYTKWDIDNRKKPYLKSRLDDDLDIAITNYLVYQNKLLRRRGDRNTLMAKNDYFFDTINRLFEPTHKSLFEDTEDITDASLILKAVTNTGKKLNVFELSSGEKQLLLILLTVLCQDEKPSILLMDEPEISLHLRWQYELIEIIRTLNPNCQVIIATHSPSIYGKGWRDKVFFMNQIITELTEQTL